MPRRVYRLVCRDFTHQSFAGKSKARQNGGVKKTSKLEDLVNVHHFSGRAGPARAPPPLLLLPLPTDWLRLSEAKKSRNFCILKGKNCPGGLFRLFAKNGSLHSRIRGFESDSGEMAQKGPSRSVVLPSVRAPRILQFAHLQRHFPPTVDGGGHFHERNLISTWSVPRVWRVVCMLMGEQLELV